MNAIDLIQAMRMSTRVFFSGCREPNIQELNINGGSVALGSRGPSLRKEAEERDRLVALVKLQVRELDAIKAEINLLR